MFDERWEGGEELGQQLGNLWPEECYHTVNKMRGGKGVRNSGSSLVIFGLRNVIILSIR